MGFRLNPLKRNLFSKPSIKDNRLDQGNANGCESYIEWAKSFRPENSWPLKKKLNKDSKNESVRL